MDSTGDGKPTVDWAEDNIGDQRTIDRADNTIGDLRSTVD